MTAPLPAARDNDPRRQIIREAIREARAARREDSRMCRCGHTASEHLARLSDGEIFHCCDESCDCKKYDEDSVEVTP